MIRYIEKGYSLHEKIASTGHRLEQVDGIWVADDSTAVQEIIDNFTIAEAAAPIISEIKQYARALILARIPEWKQTNITARAVELLTIKSAGGLSASETAEETAINNAWAWVKAVRAKSNEHELALLAVTDFTKLHAYDWRAGWPA